MTFSPKACPNEVILFVLLTMFFATASASAQQCTKRMRELPAAAELLGFHLGMTREQVKARVPQTVFGRTDAFGVSKTTINPYFDPRLDKTRFEGVRTISLDLLDDRLTSIWIGYDETFKAHSVDQFVTMISQSLQIPGRWSSWKSRGQQMRCADFQVIVATVGGGPSLRVLDLAAENTIAARRQAKEEQDAATEVATANSNLAPADIIGDKQTKTYYLGACQPAKEIPPLNKIAFRTAEEAEKAGFKPAKTCP